MGLNEKVDIDSGNSPLLPYDKIEAGDIIVAKYGSENWTKYLPWEGYNHAGLISKIDGKNISIIEAQGQVSSSPSGPQEYFYKDSLFGKIKPLELILLKPKFPNPIREKGKWYVPRIFKTEISEVEARNRAIEFARNQIGEPYDEYSNKWQSDSWYCSKLVFKAYSMTVAGLYLETYQFPSLGTFPVSKLIKSMSSGPSVTPEDLVDSKNSIIYYHFKIATL